MKIAMILPSLANKGPILVARDLCIEYKKWDMSVPFFILMILWKWNCPVPQSGFHFGDRLIGMPLIFVHSHMYRSDAYVFFHKPILRKCRTKFITTLHQHIAEQMSV